MAISILVADASPDFCALIRQTLEATGRYQVTVVSSGVEASKLIGSVEARLAIVDLGLSDPSGEEIIHRLREENSDLAVIGIPVQGQTEATLLEELRLDGILSKPFYLPDLPKIVANALRLTSDEQQAPVQRRPGPIQDSLLSLVESIPLWLEDRDQARDALELSLDMSSAMAALFTRGRLLWSSSGGLSEHQLQMLTAQIADSWATEGARGSLAQFVRLPDIAGDFLLYATGVAGDIVLSLVFSADTPFGIARKQTEDLARKLIKTEPSQLPTKAPPTHIDVEGDLTAAEWRAQAGGESDSAEFAFLSDLDLPPPDPDLDSSAANETDQEAYLELPALPRDWLPEGPYQAGTLPFLDEVGAETGTTQAEAETEIPLPEARYQLSFTAVLVPRFPEHRLEGPLAERIKEWVERLCLAWDWRADKVNLDADYLCLTVSLLPEIAPADAIERLSRDLSERILDTFKGLSKDLPSHRFWARSFMLIAGGPPAAARIDAFVREMRRAQGFQV